MHYLCRETGSDKSHKWAGGRVMSWVTTKKMPRDFNLFLFGDAHVGAKAFYAKGWGRLIDMMHSSLYGLKPGRNYGVDHGDIIEAVTIDDPRFDLQTTKQASMIHQSDYYRELVKPIAKKVLVLLEGNHTKKLWKYGNICQDICDRMKIEYGTYVCKINYVDNKNRLMFKHYACHGFGSIGSRLPDEKRRVTNMLLALKNKLRLMCGDAVLMSMGHTHQSLINKPDNCLFLCDDQRQITKGYTADLKTCQNAAFIHPDNRYYVNTGTFRKTALEGGTDYGEMAGYPPIELGFSIALIRDGALTDIKKIVVG